MQHIKTSISKQAVSTLSLLLPMQTGQPVNNARRQAWRKSLANERIPDMERMKERKKERKKQTKKERKRER